MTSGLKAAESADLQLDVAAFQGAAFAVGEGVDRFVVGGQGADLGGTRGGQVALELEDHETGALAVFQLLLLGFEGGFGELPGQLGGADQLVGRLDRRDGVVDLDEDCLFALLDL